MANVIDKLRVQGNPAPRRLPSQPDSGLRRFGGQSGGNRGDGPPDLPTMHFMLSHSQLQNRNSNSGRNMNQAARRREHLQRVQQANQGLSTMDMRQPDLSSQQFMLRGKPASADTLLHRQHLQQQLQQQEESGGGGGSGGGGKSAHAGLRSSQGGSDNANGILPPGLPGAAVNGYVGNMAPASAPSVPSNHRSLNNAYFVLAHANTLHPTQSRNAHRGQSGGKGKGGEVLQGEVPAGGFASGRRQPNPRRSAGSTTSFELTGHQVMTPRSVTGYEDGLSYRDLYTRSPRQRSGVKEKSFAYRDRKSPGLKDATVEQPAVDPNSLRQCLHVHPSNGTSAQALKQFAQSMRTEAKVNYNNPYRHTRSKQGRMLPESERRYIFDSVASYIHFNKIYPHMKDSAGSPQHKLPAHRSGFPGSAVKEGMSKVPHLAGFPKHCTDTILLRMMFEMNRPGAVHGIGLGHQAAGAPSVKSSTSNKYSDTGRYPDLDEYLGAGDTPSVKSQRQHHQRLNSNHALPSSPPREEDEGVKEGADEEDGRRIADEEGDTSTLITATTPGRLLAADEDAEDADDEASQWNTKREEKSQDNPVVIKDGQAEEDDNSDSVPEIGDQ